MPILDFEGKSVIISYHLRVPFRSLQVDKKKSFSSKGSKKLLASLDDNLIIHGDNLHALKSLLPRYAGKVKCIYIDPPYNTGNESWVFNDNVNSPMMQEWFKKEVGIDDLEKHDKWLCMMWPRLQLLKELLSEDGVLICAIDHNEQEHLGLILKEIFSEKKLSCVTIVHNPRGIQGDNFSYTHEYAYFVLPNHKAIGLEVLGKKDTSNFRNWGAESKRTDAKNCFYPIIVKGDKVIGFGDVLAEDKHPKNQTIKKDKDKYEIWPIDKNGVERKWRYARQSVEAIKHLLKVKVKNGTNNIEIEIGKDFGSYKTVWTGSQYDSNKYGTQLLKTIIPNCAFNFPKSFYNVSDCIKAIVGNDKDAIVLDSFAGSGTTAHAVLDLNKEDGGNRKFILVECEDYADNITAQRVRRVMKGVPIAKNERLKKGLGGSFTYCTLGEEISTINLLRGKNMPSYKQLAEYVFYTATGRSLNKTVKINPAWFIGETDFGTFYLIYKPDLPFLRSKKGALNLEMAEKIKQFNTSSKKTIFVYAPEAYMEHKELKKNYNIVFCHLPYAIHKIMGF